MFCIYRAVFYFSLLISVFLVSQGQAGNSWDSELNQNSDSCQDSNVAYSSDCETRSKSWLSQTSPYISPSSSYNTSDENSISCGEYGSERSEGGEALENFGDCLFPDYLYRDYYARQLTINASTDRYLNASKMIPPPPVPVRPIKSRSLTRSSSDSSMLKSFRNIYSSDDIEIYGRNIKSLNNYQLRNSWEYTPSDGLRTVKPVSLHYPSRQRRSY